MGNSKSTVKEIADNPNRKVYLQYKKMSMVESGMMGKFIVYTFILRYQRFRWEVNMRYSDLMSLQRQLARLHPEDITRIDKLSRRNKLFWTHDQAFLDQRASAMTKYLQDVLDFDYMIDIPIVRALLSSSSISFNPDYGRKGKEGWLKKCSGGYNEKFSMKAGDFIKIWKWRWIVLTDTCIIWYKNPHDTAAQGSLLIDQEFVVFQTGRVLAIRTGTRKFMFRASTTREALEWAKELQAFYNPRPKAIRQLSNSSYPPRANNDVKIYTTAKDYFQSLAVALLSAQKEIMITSWKNSPGVLLTRPPLPPLRLDQILQYKAEQGIQIYILLYKEVEHIGQGNDSMKVKRRLESLSPNIHVIRHPNKFIGGATAVLWSHHEKLAIIDRNIAHVGGIDVSYQRWDDEFHHVTDEDGIKFPGNDYRQPAPDAFQPARSIDFDKEANDSDEEMIEVEVATANNSSNLPVAMSTVVDYDDQPYVEDVIVDFGITHRFTAAATRQRSASRTASTATSSSGSHLTKQALATRSPTSVARQSPSSHHHPPNHHLPSGEIKDNMSDVSSNLEEDRHAPDTQEEKEIMDTYEHGSDPGSIMSSRSASAGYGELAEQLRTSVRAATAQLTSSFTSVTDRVSSFTSQAQSFINNYVEQTYTTKKMKTSNYWETRDMYPRMGWHDVQAVVSGHAARDVASHFVQRWNHHRLSVADYYKPILNEITDDLYYGICARCELPRIFETFTHCPKCNYDLGPINSYSLPLSTDLLPPKPETEFTYLVYSFTYPITSKLPFRLQGDCPVVIAAIINNSLSSSSASNFEDHHTGVLLEIHGEKSVDFIKKQQIDATSIEPNIGDVILAINDVPVSHLNANQIKRFLKRIKKGVSVMTKSTESYRITFRRHYYDEDLLEEAERAGNLNEYVDVGAPIGPDTEVPASDITPMARLPPPPGTPIVIAAPYSPPTHATYQTKSLPSTSTSSPTRDASATVSTPTPSSSPIPGTAVTIVTTSAASAASASNQPKAYTSPLQASRDAAAASSTATATVAPTSPTPTPKPSTPTPNTSSSSSPQPSTRTSFYTPNTTTTTPNGAKVTFVSSLPGATTAAPPIYHPICQFSAHREIALCISELFHNCCKNWDVPSRISTITKELAGPYIAPALGQAPGQAPGQSQTQSQPQGAQSQPQIQQEVGSLLGSCKVQVLRSVGKWSIGVTNTEASILQCYLETIANAQHFIYIENQFFIGNLVNDGLVQNGIASALVERILKAHAAKQRFRVIVIIPLHPNGDFSGAMKAQHVMHFEYATINRGQFSLYSQLRNRAPDISVDDYIGFFSLRNWGVLNNKIVSDQIYVHDKLMIIDDRILIVGSANINDRSMIGGRDSEMALRIEDTFLVDTLFNGQAVQVGYLPHTVRLKLMKQHMGEDNIDLFDMLHPTTYQKWRDRATKNSFAYHELDGPISLYGCISAADYKRNLSKFSPRSYLDPESQAMVHSIKGFVVDWPRNLFEKDDLSPKLQTRAIIPNELWV